MLNVAAARASGKIQDTGIRPEQPMPKEDQNSSRRDFLQKLAALGTAGVITPAVLSACGGGGENGGTAGQNGDVAEADFSCTDTSGLTEQQVQQRQNSEYTDDSPHEDRLCNNCQLYTEPEEGEQCGGCQVIPGPIHPEGWCNLWVPQQA